MCCDVEHDSLCNVLEKSCGLKRIGWSNRDDVQKFKRGDLDGVFHIHGSYHDVHEVLLDTTDTTRLLIETNFRQL
jgi:hypothetical protein